MRRALTLIIALALNAAPALGQTAKEVKTKKGASVALVNLLNLKPGCASVPAPVAIPVVREKPANGTVQMLIVATDVPAAGNCAARKAPAVALIYSPKNDFVGSDSVAIEIETGNRTTILTYHITVMPQGETL